MEDWSFAPALARRGLGSSLKEDVEEVYDGKRFVGGLGLTRSQLPGYLEQEDQVVWDRMLRATWAPILGAVLFWLAVLAFSLVDFDQLLQRVKIFPLASRFVLVIGLVFIGLLGLALLAPVLAIEDGRAWIFSIPLATGAIVALAVRPSAISRGREKRSA
jgi:hypothetical protein